MWAVPSSHSLSLSLLFLWTYDAVVSGPEIMDKFVGSSEKVSRRRQYEAIAINWYMDVVCVCDQSF